MSDENNNGRTPPGGRPPLTLKPRAGGSVSAGTVKQSFSHGRTKTVVVETKRARPHTAPGGNLAAPSTAERRVFDPPRPAAPAQGQRPATPNDGLSAEERAARQRVIETARAQQAQQEADRRASEDSARAAAAEAARAAQAAAAAAAAASPPPPAAPVAAAPAPAPVAPAPAPVAAAPPPAPVRPPPRPPCLRPPRRRRFRPRLRPRPSHRRRALRNRVRPPRPACCAASAAGACCPARPAPISRRRDRRDDRPTTTTYRPPATGRYEGASFNQRAPRADARPPRDDRGPPPRRDDRPQGDRPRQDGPAPAAGTVRYSALAPRPAPGARPGPGGPRGPGGRPGVGPAAPPATPEVQRATRQAPRPGGAALDRRPEDDDRIAAATPAPARPSAAPRARRCVAKAA